MPKGTSFICNDLATLTPSKPKYPTLKELREQYSKAINTLDSVKKLRDINPVEYLDTHYAYILDYWGNIAQKLLFKIGIIEEEIKEATL